MDASDRLEQLTVVNSLFEAQRIEALLAEHDVACQVQSFADSAYAGIFQTQKGWGEVRVARTDLERATELLGTLDESEVDAAELDAEAAAAETPAEAPGPRRPGRLLLALVILVVVGMLSLWDWRCESSADALFASEALATQLVDAVGDAEPEWLAYHVGAKGHAGVELRSGESEGVLWRTVLPTGFSWPHAKHDVVFADGKLLLDGQRCDNHFDGCKGTVLALGAKSGRRAWEWSAPKGCVLERFGVVHEQILALTVCVEGTRSHPALYRVAPATGDVALVWESDRRLVRIAVRPDGFGLCLENRPRDEGLRLDIRTGETTPAPCPEPTRSARSSPRWTSPEEPAL